MASASAVEWTATVAMPSSFAARRTRRAISPRLAIRILSNIAYSITKSGSPYSTGVPSSTKIAVTVPARGATMSLKVFIASTRSSLSPAWTFEPTSTKALASGEGLRIGGADHRRQHRARVDRRGAAVAEGGQLSGDRRRRDDRGRRRGDGHRHLRGDRSRDADAQVALLDLDLGQIGLGDQRRELAHEIGIEGAVLGHRF